MNRIVTSKKVAHNLPVQLRHMFNLFFNCSKVAFKKIEPQEKDEKVFKYMFRIYIDLYGRNRYTDYDVVVTTCIDKRSLPHFKRKHRVKIGTTRGFGTLLLAGLVT